MVNLPGLDDKPYWDLVVAKADELKSDGCTLVSEMYHICCQEHDVHYRTGKTVYGDPISVRDANARFRQQMQARSKLGKFSPVSWLRWIGVTVASPFFYHPKEQ